jgi:diaminopimelate decarboxylase
MKDLDYGALAAQHGTPFYVYSMDDAVAHAKRLRAHLPSRVDLLYAAKANANSRVLQLMQPHVSGLDISSGGELRLATAAGYSPSVMSFAGPGKSDQELELAIGSDIHVLSVESPNELRRAAAIAARLDKQVSITLRINPLHIPKEFPMKMGGLPSQFGIAEEDVDPVIEEALRTPRIRLRGFHIFSGTNCLEKDAIVENVRQTLGIALRLAEKHDLSPEIVNLGGGFGIPYFFGQEDMDVDALGAAIGETVQQFHDAQPRFAQARYLLELGRYLIGAFGAYVTRVIDVKQTRGKRFVILDGGMHHCFPATGNFGQLIKKNYPVRNLTSEAKPVLQELVGPLCTPIDSMARALELPEAQIGDLIAFMQCGAYSYAASPLLFLSHDTPLELVEADGKCEVARTRKPASAF